MELLKMIIFFLTLKAFWVLLHIYKRYHVSCSFMAWWKNSRFFSQPIFSSFENYWTVKNEKVHKVISIILHLIFLFEYISCSKEPTRLFI